MKYLLERHAFAPELNTLYRRVAGAWVTLAKAGSSMSRKAFSSIAEYRKNNTPILEPFIHAVVRTHYDNPEYKSLERAHAGRVSTRMQALEFARNLKKGLCPGGRVSVQTQIIG